MTGEMQISQGGLRREGKTSVDGEDMSRRHITKQATATICCGGVTKHRWRNGDDMLHWHVTS